MFGIFIYDLLFFAIPTVILAFFGVSLYRYLHAKRQNKKAPDSFSSEELNRRGIFLAVTSIIAGALLLVVIGFTALIFMAVAFM